VVIVCTSIEEFMRAKIVFSCALLLAVLNLAPARAQYSTPGQEAPPPVGVKPGEPGQQEEMFHAPGLSSWITYHKGNGCDEPTGNGCPIMTELFLRSGWAVPTNTTTFGRTLDLGWDIDGGGRLLLFNPAETRAWTFTAGLSNVNYHGQHPEITFPVHVFVNNVLTKVNVSVHDLNQTFANLGMGREWYLWAPANAPGRHWRVGLDFGGRWGTEKLDLHEIRHMTDTIGGVYSAAHTDLEIPMGACTFLAGLRLEWNYTWGDVVQAPSDVMSFNGLISLGIRF
jgi:hypothetical protein